MYKIQVYDSAKSNINTIYDYCLEIYGIKYVIKIRSKIKSEIKKLMYFPKFNPIYTISNDTVFRKRIVNRRYIVVFRVYFNYVYV